MDTSPKRYIPYGYYDITGKWIPPNTQEAPQKEAGRDWVEDRARENGNYSSICCVCQEQFVGHKRRLVCRVCVDK